MTMKNYLFFFVVKQLAKHGPAAVVVPVFIPIYSDLANNLFVFYLCYYYFIPLNFFFIS